MASIQSVKQTEHYKSGGHRPYGAVESFVFVFNNRPHKTQPKNVLLFLYHDYKTVSDATHSRSHDSKQYFKCGYCCKDAAVHAPHTHRRSVQSAQFQGCVTNSTSSQMFTISPSVAEWRWITVKKTCCYRTLWCEVELWPFRCKTSSHYSGFLCKMLSSLASEFLRCGQTLTFWSLTTNIEQVHPQV